MGGVSTLTQVGRPDYRLRCVVLCRGRLPYDVTQDFGSTATFDLSLYGFFGCIFVFWIIMAIGQSRGTLPQFGGHAFLPKLAGR